ERSAAAPAVPRGRRARVGRGTAVRARAQARRDRSVRRPSLGRAYAQGRPPRLQRVSPRTARPPHLDCGRHGPHELPPCRTSRPGGRHRRADWRVQPLDRQPLHARAGRRDGRRGPRALRRPDSPPDLPPRPRADGRADPAVYGGHRPPPDCVDRHRGNVHTTRMRKAVFLCVLGVLSGGAFSALYAATSEVADAVQRRDAAGTRALLQKKADVNRPQNDGTTALLWAVRYDDLGTADALIHAGANVSTPNRDGATPLQMAALNGSAPMIEKLIKAGADPNAALTPTGDTALMMAARTGKTSAVSVLIESGANVNAKESWGGTTPLMWAVSENHPDAVKALISAGADVSMRSNYVAAANGRGFEGRTPVSNRTDGKPEEFASGWLTPLMLAAREGHVDVARALLDAGADINAVAGDGKTALAVAIFNGNYDFASLLVDRKADVNKADAQRFTPLFYAVDRRNMETAPNFPWMVTADPMPLIRKLLDAGANTNALVNNTPRARMREGSPRIVFATALMRAAFAADLELVKLLLERGADPKILSRDSESMLSAAAGLAFIHGYHRGRSAED